MKIEKLSDFVHSGTAFVLSIKWYDDRIDETFYRKFAFETYRELSEFSEYSFGMYHALDDVDVRIDDFIIEVFCYVVDEDEVVVKHSMDYYHYERY